MTTDPSDRPIAWVVDRDGPMCLLLRAPWSWADRYDDVDESVQQRAVALIPITRLQEAEERHNRQAAELREARDAALSDVERLTAFKDLTPRIEIDCRGPVPYVEILNPSPSPQLPIPLPEDLRGWLHPTSDQISREMGDALATVFGSHREPFSVITPRMVSEQLVHIRDQQAVEVHHHDIEKHAESYMEGYTAAEQHATEPVAGYDEPDAGNPAHLRFAAALMASTNDWVHGSFHQSISAHLRAAADLLERDLAARRDREARDCEWSDYRKNYGVRLGSMTDAHKAFVAGWDAARGETHESTLS